MSDSNQSDPKAGQRSFHPPKNFPDPVTCRVKDAGFGGYFDCLALWATHCPHTLGFGTGHFCRHPTAPEILARSAGKNKPT
jgi:hypothetical protein